MLWLSGELKITNTFFAEMMFFLSNWVCQFLSVEETTHLLIIFRKPGDTVEWVAVVVFENHAL